MIELPISEEIYDYDTITLSEIHEKVTEAFSKLKDKEEKTKEENSWLKKAQRILDMISLEISERKIVESFGDMCMKGDHVLNNIDNFNPYKLNDQQDLVKTLAIQEEYVSYPSTHGGEESSEREVSKETPHPLSISEVGSRASHRTSQFETEDEKDDSSSVQGKLWAQMKIQKKGGKPGNITSSNKKKQSAMYLFMKETLEKCKAESTALVVGKASTQETKKKEPEPQEQSEVGRRPLRASTQNYAAGNKKLSVPRMSNAVKEQRLAAIAALKDSTQSTKVSSALVMGSAKPDSQKRKNRPLIKVSDTTTDKKQKPSTAQNNKRKVEEEEEEDEEEEEIVYAKEKKGVKKVENKPQSSKLNSTNSEQSMKKTDAKGNSKSKSISEANKVTASLKKSSEKSEKASVQPKENQKKASKSLNNIGAENPGIKEEIPEKIHEEEGGEENSQEGMEQEDSIADETVNQVYEKDDDPISNAGYLNGDNRRRDASVESIKEEIIQTAEQENQLNLKRDAQSKMINEINLKLSANKENEVLLKQNSNSETNIKGETSNTDNRENLQSVPKEGNKSNAILIADEANKIADNEQEENDSGNEFEPISGYNPRERSLRGSEAFSNFSEKKDTSTYEQSDLAMDQARDRYADENYTYSAQNTVKYTNNEQRTSKASNWASDGEKFSENIEKETSDSQGVQNDTVKSEYRSRPMQALKAYAETLKSKKPEDTAQEASPRKQEAVSKQETTRREFIEPVRYSETNSSKPADDLNSRAESRSSTAQPSSQSGADSTSKHSKNASDSVQSNQKTANETANQEEKAGATTTSNKKPPLRNKQNIPPKKDPKPQMLLEGEQLRDYSDVFSSFHELFSGSYVNSAHFDYMGSLREIYTLFGKHVSQLDNVDSYLDRYKFSMAPLELSPNDILSMNDSRQLLMYAAKTDLNLNLFMERQNTFIQNMNLIKNGNDNSETEFHASKSLYYRVVKTRNEVYDIVTRSFLRKRNWLELPHGVNLRTTWNLLWTWSKPEIDMGKLLYFQKVNHFPGNKAIVRKDLLKKNLEKIQKLGQKAASAFDIIPLTFALPKEISAFMACFYEGSLKDKAMNVWIMKPIGKSRGRGISLINDLIDLKYTEQVVVQKYLRNPMLLQGYKFDMRIYVLVTSIMPLEVFIYKEGFARMSTAQFTLDPSDLSNNYIHLTNYAIQKYNQDAFGGTSENIMGGTKISLKTLRTKLEGKGVRWSHIWEQVCDIVLKSLISCQGEIPHNPNCFELFGYDIIIDTDQRCWLLEVNSSPSLSREHLIDDIIKQQLIDDTIDLVNPLFFDRQRLVEVLERRIKEEQGCKSKINTQNNSKVQLNRDLQYILCDQPVRKVGEMPKIMGNYERIAPSEKCDKFTKLVQSYKLPPSRQNKP